MVKDHSYSIKQNVQFVGLKEIDPEVQEQIKKVIFEHYIELERVLKNIKGLKIHFKPQKNTGGRVKYSAHMIVEAETGRITVDKLPSNIQWDPVAIAHQLIKKAKQEILHKYKTDSQYRKPYEKGAL